MIKKDTGFIVYKKPFGNTSDLIGVFSRSHGLIKSLAKGSRSKQKSSIYEYGNLVDFELYQRLEEQLGTLVCHINKSFGTIFAAGNTKLSALIVLSVCELIENFCPPSEINTQIFDKTLDLFNFLTEEQDTHQITKAYLEYEQYLVITSGFTTNQDNYISPANILPSNNKRKNLFNHSILLDLIKKQKPN